MSRQWCSSCRLGGELVPLAGTDCAFCRTCAETVQAIATYMEKRGATTEEIVTHIAKRYTHEAQR